MKSLMLLWKELLTEVGSWLGTCTTRDLTTATRRFEHEGLSFFTITLPSFADDLQKGLDEGRVTHDLWNGFKFQGGLPRFLGGFLELVFDRKTGVLLDDPSKDAIFSIRQACLFFKKIELPCSDARVARAFDEYILCEQEVRRFDTRRTEDELLDFQRVSRLLYSELFQRLDERILHLDVVPKHGPGSTADRISSNGKYSSSVWTERLESVFPAGEFILPNWRYRPDRSITYLEPGAEIPVRVITVPKTLKTPRIIAIEPTCMQYTQQSILGAFVEEWRRIDTLHSFLGFDEQDTNQYLAHQGSETGLLATLDLSSASDRVSNQLVRAMLANFPNLADGIDATRSRKADVPGHGVIRLAKYASMGSATCFPMEALVFLTCVFIGIERSLNTQLTHGSVRRFMGSVRIFGDDIIVPKEHVQSVVASLEAYGFKVNSNKSFWNGKFRESCGKEYYDGFDVSVVKLTQALPSQRQHAEEVLSLSATRNQLYQLGLWRTCKWIDRYLSDLLGHYPTVFPTSPVVGRHSVLGYETQRLSDHTHAPLVKGYVPWSRSPIDKLDGEPALLKFLLKQGEIPFEKGHLERAGRPDSVNLKIRWAASH